jgi:hypothetical protein
VVKNMSTVNKCFFVVIKVMCKLLSIGLKIGRCGDSGNFDVICDKFNTLDKISV